MTQTITKSSLVAAILVASVLPPSFANDTLRPTSPNTSNRPADVALHAGGVLYGTVTDSQQQPVADQQVEVLFRGEAVRSAMTDAQGHFVVRGLNAGTHTLRTSTGEGVVQLWAPNTAPPSAHQGALLVTGSETIVRAQGYDNSTRLRHLVILGLAGGGLAWALDYNDSGS